MAVNTDIPMVSGLTPHNFVSSVQLFGKKNLLQTTSEQKGETG
jgi:hypothetical protein